jgi:hypothetical protein
MAQKIALDQNQNQKQNTQPVLALKNQKQVDKLLIAVAGTELKPRLD